MSCGKVYLVGAGPGDAALITVRGAELLGRADVVVYDHLVSQRLLRRVRPTAKCVYAGKQAGQATLSQEAINALLAAEAKAGKTVVRLKGGDPLIFGRGGEEALALAAAGVDFEIIPGVTAAAAAGACAGVPLTHRGLSSCVGLVTGHEGPSKESSDLDWAAVAAWPGTLVFYMGVANIEAICRRLTEAGMDGQTPAAAVRWAGTARQQVLTATVGDLPARARAADLRPPAVVIVGRVVDMREQLAWFERRPLFGQRIIVTRPAGQAGELSARLAELGAEPIECPTIAIAPPTDPGPLTQAIEQLSSFAWIAFMSVHAVDAVLAALARAGADSRALAGVKLCCIGPATADRLARAGLRADLVPPQFTSESLANALAQAADLSDASVLCPRSDIAPPDLPDALAGRGAKVTTVTAYRTRTDTSCAAELRCLLEADQAEWITFTSASTVAGAIEAVGAGMLRGRRVRLASIGPATSRALVSVGLAADVEAAEHTIDGLVAAILAAPPRDGATAR